MAAATSLALEPLAAVTAAAAAADPFAAAAASALLTSWYLKHMGRGGVIYLYIYKEAVLCARTGGVLGARKRFPPVLLVGQGVMEFKRGADATSGCLL